MVLDENYQELEKITEQILEITDITLEDDEHGNPRRLNSEQHARLRELAREQRTVMKKIEKAES